MKNNSIFILVIFFLLQYSLICQDVVQSPRKLKFKVYGGASVFDMGNGSKTTIPNFFTIPLEIGKYYEEGQLFDIERTITRSNITSNSKTYRVGFEYSLPLSSKLLLLHGIEANYFHHDFKNEILSSVSDVYAQIRIVKSGIYEYGEPFYTYNFINYGEDGLDDIFYGDFEPSSGHSLSITNNLNLDYAVSKRFGVQLGGFIGVLTDQKVDGFVVNFFEGYFVESKNELNPLMAGLSGGLRFDINDKHSISFQYQKYLTNYFDNRSEVFDFDKEVKPNIFGFKYSYTINGANSSDANAKKKGSKKTKKQF